MQYGILGSVVIALGAAVVFLYRSLNQANISHMEAVEKCHEQSLDITLKQVEAQNNMANALEGVKSVVQTALDVIKR
jgi:hypothetical protein